MSPARGGIRSKLAETLHIEEIETTPDEPPLAGSCEPEPSGYRAGPAPQTRRSRRAERRQAREEDEAELVRACMGSHVVNQPANKMDLRCFRRQAVLAVVIALAVAVTTALTHAWIAL